jgi:hypothetical protein
VVLLCAVALLEYTKKECSTQFFKQAKKEAEKQKNNAARAVRKAGNTKVKCS